MYDSFHFIVLIGFVETMVEIDESDGRATLNVSISLPQPHPLLRFEIMFRLFANTKDGSAGMGDASEFLKQFQ